ncbi:MAG: hypothetical protein ACO1PQ_10390 [Rhizobium sp.]
MTLAIVPSILGQLAKEVTGLRGWQDWRLLPERPADILLFEAFVSGGASDGHAADARLATLAAEVVLTSTEPRSYLGEEKCMSTLGAALLHAGLSADLDELHRPCLVVRAEKVLSAR